jgi:hypothetical protein
MNSKKIIEMQNSLNPTLLSYMKNICFNTLSWAYLDSSALPNNIEEENENKPSSFSSTLYMDGKRANDLSAFFESALTIILDKSGLKLFNLNRIRVGMMLKSNQHYVNDAHIDDETDHMTALLYLNTCDAPTILYDKFYDKNSQIHSKVYLEKHLQNNLNVYREISCIENNAVIFNGLRYHSSSIQTNTKRRIVVTYNFTVL